MAAIISRYDDLDGQEVVCGNNICWEMMATDQHNGRWSDKLRITQQIQVQSFYVLQYPGELLMLQLLCSCMCSNYAYALEKLIFEHVGNNLRSCFYKKTHG